MNKICLADNIPLSSTVWKLFSFKVENTRKLFKTQHIWPSGPTGSLLLRAIHFSKAAVEMVLYSSWHVPLRLTVFEIFAVKWQNRCLRGHQKPFLVPTFGDPFATKGGSYVRHTALIVQNFTRVDRCRCWLRRDIYPRTKKTELLYLRFDWYPPIRYTSVWREMMRI